jgi:lipopolysaccharide biosynthesis protein
MFWARPRALAPLFGLRLDWGDYPEEPVPIDGTMIHALERLLPFAAGHAGFRYATTHVPGVTW